MIPATALTFRLAGRLYGLDVAATRGVERKFRLTPLDQSIPWLRGVFNLRGRIHCAIDLAARVGLAGPAPAEPQLIILKKRPWGLLVEAVEDVLPLDETSPATGPLPVGLDSKFVAGAAELAGETLVLFKTSAIIAVDQP